MIITNKVTSVAKCAARESGKYAMGQVRVKGHSDCTTFTATDARTAVRLTLPIESDGERYVSIKRIDALTKLDPLPQGKCNLDLSNEPTESEGRFPPIDSIFGDMAARPTTVQVHLSAKLLKQLLDAMIPHLDGDQKVTMSIGQPSQPILVVGQSVDCKIEGLIVPMS